MKFTTKIGSNIARSECGEYEIRMSKHPTHGVFYNAWHGDKHIAAGYKKAEVVAACERHSECK